MPGIPCFCGDTDDGPESETQVRRQRGAGSERVQKAGVRLDGSTGRPVDGVDHGQRAYNLMVAPVNYLDTGVWGPYLLAGEGIV